MILTRLVAYHWKIRGFLEIKKLNDCRENPFFFVKCGEEASQKHSKRWHKVFSVFKPFCKRKMFWHGSCWTETISKIHYEFYYVWWVFSKSWNKGKTTVVIFHCSRDKFVKGIQVFYIWMLKNWNIKGNPVWTHQILKGWCWKRS